jgi:heat shock 70kDa protein 4
MRGKLEERYAAFVQAEEKSKLLADLQEAEDWLYTEEGEDATKSAYVARLDALKQTGDPVTFRWREHEERPRAAAQLRETLSTYLSQATSGEERFAHIDSKDLQSVAETCANAQKWLEDQSVRQSERPKNQNPVLTSAEIVKKRDEVIYFCTPILSRPKPKPPVGSGTATPDTKTGGGQETPKTGKEEQQGPTEMDVD